ncbi:MAG: DUF167 family protein [Candidatus Bathyarchaeota archaeon]|nr:DUF167 family protein [Candidatus Bathyarchaeota archaeon]
MKLLKTAHGVVLDVHVKPNSKKFRVELDGDELVVLCREAPVKGKVNRELVKKLSRLFNRRVEIVSGFSSRKKKLLIRDIEAEEVNRILVSASNTQQ